MVPRQLEEVLATLPGVIEVAVYGVEDALLGEAIATSLTVMANSPLTIADVKHHCRRYLEDYRVPKYVTICAALPMTLTSEESRRALTDVHGEVEKAA